ncbi:MAG: glycosyltransferase family 4 protein, partial [Bdellovibrionales bacterium]|nr:glycosyltransferase family 4 protein [Bdellovibrionales bacterium]
MDQASNTLKLLVFHPYLLVRGGSQKYAIQTARLFSERGYEVVLCTFYFNRAMCYPELTQSLKIIALHETENSNTLAGSVKRRHAAIYRLLLWSGIAVFARFLKNLLLANRLFRKLREHEELSTRPFSIIYIHESSINYFARWFRTARAYLYCYDTPDKFRAWELADAKRAPLYRCANYLVDRIFKQNDCINHFENVFVLDEVMRRRVIEYYGRSPDKIYGGIDTTRFYLNRSHYLHDKLGVPHSTPIISCVTRFVPYRRVDDLLAAFGQVDAKGACLYINGPSEDLAYYNRLIRDYRDLLAPQGRVYLDTVPFKDERELALTYQCSRIFVFPNESQTWGNAVLEAMACGCACIVSDGCGIVEIISDNRNGLVFECGDVRNLTRLIQRVLDDPDYANQLGEAAARHIATNFSWNN